MVLRSTPWCSTVIHTLSWCFGMIRDAPGVIRCSVSAPPTICCSVAPGPLDSVLLDAYKRFLFLVLSSEIFRILYAIVAKFLFSFRFTKVFYKIFFKSLRAFFIKLLKKKLKIDLLYCFSQEIRSEDWWKLICIDSSRSFLFYAREVS